MIIKHGNLWDSTADVILFTGNSTVRKDGCLVMGRGAALEAQTKFKGCNKVFGDLVKEKADGDHYGVLVDFNHMYKRDGIMKLIYLGVFQVKFHFKDDADLSLIKYSVICLNLLLDCELRGKTVALNFPGIGWGRKGEAQVLPFLEELPDRVEIWKYPTQVDRY